MGSMHTGLEEKRDGYKSLSAFYEERAKSDVSMIVTGGYSPNFRGRLTPFSSQLSSSFQLKKHQRMNDVIREYDCKMVLQILHAGRYAYHPFSVAPSSLKAPISKFKPSELTQRQIEKTINQFVNCAKLALKAGYSGVEIMGSEGYLLNQFIAPRTNKRSDAWGGDFQKRIKFPLEIVKRIKDVFQDDALLIFRLSLLDLVEEGSSWEETVELAKALEGLGVSIINTGIGWHEARVPTIATNVPRAAFAYTTAKLKKEISTKLIAVNRFNNRSDIELCLESSQVDLISMARPFLADPQIVTKMQKKLDDEVNTCIACNQACLDHIFMGKTASCLVNPQACAELKYKGKVAGKKKKVLIVGAGVSGLSCAINASKYGHDVCVIEKNKQLGGQFHIAQMIPGKDEFQETLRYFKSQLKKYNVEVRLGVEFNSTFEVSKYDEIVMATGVKPRIPQIKGIDLPLVHHYQDFLLKEIEVKDKVVIIGAGGIGFDVAAYVTKKKSSFYETWGIDQNLKNRGGLLTKKDSGKNSKEVYVLQRSTGKFGKSLGKTTGWIKRAKLKKAGVNFLGGVEYKEITERGIKIIREGEEEFIEAQQVVICAGQLSSLVELDQETHVIGGAKLASELDAKRAIQEGHDLAFSF